jgi:CspA family cold shock protein
MVQATLRWFTDEKGHGFIAPEAGGEDLFVRYSGIAESGLREPRGGRRGLLGGEPSPEGPTGERRLKGIVRRATEL